jgi:hypothetical protein
MKNVQELVEKWELSGLLEGVKDRVFMSQALEMSAVELVNKVESGTITSEQLKSCGPLLFPLVYKAFRDKSYEVQTETSESAAAFSVFVGTSDMTLDTEPDVVHEHGTHLSRLLDEVRDVSTLCKIEVQPRETGFHLVTHLL